MKVGDTVYREEDRPVTKATILRIEGEDALLAYEEGGQGWWPLSALSKKRP